MSQQHLDHPHIGVRFQQMRRKAVAQGVQRGGLLDPRHVLGRGECPMQLSRRDRADPWQAREEPAVRTRLAPVGAQQLQQAGRQHDLAVLLALALFDMDQHPVTVDVADPEIAHLGRTKPRTVGDAESRSILQTRSRCRHQNVGHLLHAEDHGQPPRLGLELHEPLHILTPAGHAEEEPQSYNAGVEDRGRNPGIGHVQLIGPQLFRRGRVGGALQKGREILDGADMGLLSFLAHAADAHVFDHPLPKRGGSFLRHVTLLSDEGGRPRSSARKGLTHRITVKWTPNTRQSRHCRGAA